MRRWEIDAKAFELERHHQNCKFNNQPFIKARKNMDSGNYLVSLDLITCDYRLSDQALSALTRLFDDEVNHMRSKRIAKSGFKGYNIQNELSYFDGVLPQRLERFLEKLYKVSQKHNEKL